MFEALGYLLGVISIVFSGKPAMRSIEQFFNRQYPNELLDAGEVIEAVKRGLIDIAAASHELSGQGINTERLNIMVGLAQKLLSSGELIALKYRNQITEGHFLQEMSKLGYDKDKSLKLLTLESLRLTPDQIIEAEFRNVPEKLNIKDIEKDAFDQGLTPERLKVLRELRRRIPSSNDHFDFAAWHVNDQTESAKLNLDDLITDQYYTDMTALGWSRDDARRLWRAHWSAPPFFMIKDLFQTGQIPLDVLEIMYDHEQIAPFFRPALTKSFYKPPSNAEIGEMYKHGLITAADIPKMLLRTGIDPADADNLAKLIIAKSVDPNAAEKTAKQAQKEANAGLSRSMIVESYTDHIIDRNKAVELLKKLGEADDNITLTLNLEDYKIAKSEQKADIDAVKEEYLGGIIDYNGAVTELSKLNLPAYQQLSILTSLEKQTRIKSKQLTKGELDDMLNFGIIEASEYAAELSKLGYSEHYITLFGELFIAKQEKKTYAKPSGKSVSGSGGAS